MFEFFKKRLKINEDINNLKSSIFDSFSNIRKDMSHVELWISHFTEKNIKQEEKIEKIEQRLEDLSIFLKTSEIKINNAQKNKETIYDKNQIGSKNVLENLTDTQKSIFLKLLILQKESNHKWIGIKNLAQELYPDKEYNSVRSMLSHYLDILADFNLIRRTRKGKQAYVMLTEKAAGYSKEEKLKIKNKGKIKI